jgi:hypothetical protein
MKSSSETAMAPLLSMEDKMKLSTMSLALCFALVPFAANATVQHHRVLHHAQHSQRYAIPMAATALVPAVKVNDDSDGLSRNHEDCNRGCIDSN